MLATLLGLVVGIACAPLLVWVRRRAEAGAEVGDEQPAEQAPAVCDQLRAAIDLLRAAALVAGPHDEVLHSNPQGRTLGRVRGNRIANGDLLDRVRQARRQGQVVSTVLTVRREPGTPLLEFAVRLSALADGLVLVIADDRSAQLRTDEIRRDFVANISHELKTPVGALQVLAEAVEQAAGDQAAVQRFSGRMIHESKRLGELIQQIIELSRLQSDDPLVQPTEVSVDDVIAAAVLRCRELAASRSVSLTTAGTPGLAIRGNEEQLTSAVVNLVQNAIGYSDPGARVAVSSRAGSQGGADFVEISVADNGIGMRSEELERIFERFYRVDYARSRAQGGTGLGLSIVKHVVGAHGGTVAVWSKLGQGSTFTLRLPVHEDADTDGPRDQP